MMEAESSDSVCEGGAQVHPGKGLLLSQCLTFRHGLAFHFACAPCPMMVALGVQLPLCSLASSDGE
jgi:hypothetical protein